MDRTTILEKLKKYKEENSIKYGILELGVFGSVSSGTNNEQSDIDLFIKTETANPFNIVHIKSELELIFSIPIDIVRIRDKMNPFLLQKISQEGVYV